VQLDSGDPASSAVSKLKEEPNPLVSGKLGEPMPADPSAQRFAPSSRVPGAETNVGSGAAPSAGSPPDLTSALGTTVDSSSTDTASSEKSPASQPNSLGVGSVTSSTRSSSSSASGLVLGTDSSSSSGKANESSALPRYQSRIKEDPKNAVEVPFEIVVVCGPDGLVIHPGGYRITGQSLEFSRKDGLLIQELRAVVRQRATADPALRPQPRVKFLLESGGSETFWAARKQVLFSGLNWPMSLQVTGTQDPHLLGKETW
jgi:hypothetical protein